VIRLLVVDDQAMVREGFAALLNAQADIEVVGTAENGLEALAAVAEHAPDVVLMDVRMPVLDGIAATRRLPDTKVLMLTTFDLDDHIYDALAAGASGFLLKHAPAAELLHAVRVVAAGEALLAPEITKRLIGHFVSARPATLTDARPARLDALTDRETEVLRLVAGGFSNAEIAAKLVLAEQTVKSHVSRTFTKLGLRDRAQAVVLAYESGLVTAASGPPSAAAPGTPAE
jgi:DNA-binding NarL/FixJ family response regulator